MAFYFISTRSPGPAELSHVVKDELFLLLHRSSPSNIMVTTRSRSKGDITANSSDAAPAEPSSPQKTKEATPKSSEKHHKLAKTTSSHFYDGEFRSGLLKYVRF